MNWFKKQKIAVKLFLGYGVIIIAMCFIGISGYLSLLKMNHGADNLYTNNLTSIKTLSNVNASLLTQRIFIRSVLLAKTPQDQQKLISDGEDQLKKAEALFSEYSKRELTDKKRALTDKITTALVNYRNACANVMQTVLPSGLDATVQALNVQAVPYMTEARTALSELIENETTEAQQGNETLDSVAAKAQTGIIVVLLGCIVAVLLLGNYITRLIVNPLHEVVGVIEDLSAGSLRKKVELLSNDETGRIGHALNNLVDVLRRYVSGINDIALGKLDFRRSITDERNELEPALEKTVGILAEMQQDVTKFEAAIRNGKIDYRADDAKFNGAYREIVHGFNQTINEFATVVRAGTKVLGQLALGDLTARMEGEYNNNFRNYQQHINDVGEALHRVIREVSEVVAAAAGTSAEISSGTEEMAAGAQEQSMQANEVAGAVEQMSKTIQETTRYAEHAAEAARHAGEIAKSGGVVVRQTVDGIDRIAQVVQQSADTVAKLGESSEQIGAIIQVIDEIADQTNLLALNAAIEAARAGEQGRGFAVVADEVRKLAERTTKATKEIAGMIKSIQQDTRIAVNAMGQGTAEVALGKELAGKAGVSLTEIIDGSEKVIDIVAQLAAASQEEAATSEQISKNIEAISSVTEENASGISEIARSAAELDKMAARLQELIAQFTVDSDRQFAAPARRALR